MGHCHVPAPVPPSWLGNQLHWPSAVRGEYRITGFRPGHAPGRIRTGTSSSRGLNPLGERVTTACLFRELVASLEPLPVPILVRNLEDISCPPARLLIPGERVLSTSKKIAAFLEWMHDNHLG